VLNQLAKGQDIGMRREVFLSKGFKYDLPKILIRWLGGELTLRKQRQEVRKAVGVGREESLS
jgi:hypothetical protein